MSGLSANRKLPLDRAVHDTTRVRYTLQGEPFADSSRNFIVHSHRLAGIVLPERDSNLRSSTRKPAWMTRGVIENHVQHIRYLWAR
jgi:hypothetical protein